MEMKGENRYMVMNVVKRRRVDSMASELSQFTYLAHPFAKENGFRLLDDKHLDKILSIQSLSTDINDIIGRERENAVPRNELVPIEDDEL